MPIDPDEVRASVTNSRRYRHIAKTLIARLANEEIPKSKNTAEAEKRTKRRLHQIFGAYATQLPYDKLIAQLQAAQSDPNEFKQTCANILRQHASTAERLPDLENFYAPIFEITGQPDSILDLACGLNPLTIPWMNLPPTTTYLAADIDTEMTRFLNEFLKLSTPGQSAGSESDRSDAPDSSNQVRPLANIHLPSASRQAFTNDLIAAPPEQSADVAFLFKTLPCLQHQTSDLLSILDRIQANWLVISFPTRSLGNRNKGMTETYRAFLKDLIKPRSWHLDERLIPSELIFIISRKPWP